MAKQYDPKKQAQETAAIVEDALRSIGSRIGELFEEATSQAQDVSKAMASDVKGSLNSLAKISNTLADAYVKASEGALKTADISKTLATRQAKILALETRIEIARRNGAKNVGEMLAELEAVREQEEEITKELKKQLQYSKNISKATGYVGGALKGLKKITGALGLDNIEHVFAEASQEAGDMAKKLTKGGTESVGIIGKTKIAMKGLGVAMKGILESLADPLVIFGLLIKSAKFLMSIMTETNQRIRDIGNNLGGSGEGVAAQIQAAGDAAGDMYYFTEELQAGYLALNKAAGLNLKFNEANAKTFHDLTQYMGMSAENASELFKISASMGKPFSKMYDTFADTVEEMDNASGYYVQSDEIMENIAKSSASVRSSFRGNFQAMVRTAHAAARLGVTMEEIQNASRKTLDFESSMEAEIRAELALGKDLNLEKLRMATLTRDTATMQAEQERLVRETMDAAEGNQMILESTADALGMSVEQYTAMADKIRGNTNLSREQLRVQRENQDSQAEQGKKAETFDRTMKSIMKSIKAILEPIATTLEPAFRKTAEALSGFMGSEVGKFLIKLLGVAAGGAIVLKAGKGLIDLLNPKKLFGGELGSSSANPMYTYNINEAGGDGGGGDLLSTGLRLGSRWTKSMKLFKGASKLFGGKSTMVGRGLRNLSAMFGKRSSFVNQIVKNNATLSKIFPKLSTLNSKLPQDIAMNIGKTFKIDKAGNVLRMAGGGAEAATTAAKSTSWFSKAGKFMKGAGKVLGPVAAIADVAIGGFTGYGQSQLSPEEQRAQGIKEGISAGEATTLGILTGGAERGSMFSESLGIEKGSAGDEAMGMLGAAGRGAMIGMAFGPIGAAVGGGIGLIAEGFKIFSDPNSSLRQGISAGLDWVGDKISSGVDWVGEKLSSAWDTVSGWGGDIADWASDTWSSVSEGFSSFTSSVMDIGGDLLDGASDMLSSAGSWVSDTVSSAGDWVSDTASSIGSTVAGWFGFANGGIAKGGFRAFASGGTVTEPTLGMVGEGQYNEAIVPLPDGKSIPVQMGGGGGGGGVGNGEVIALLQKLISVVEQGGDVYLDGNKVGKSLALATSQMG